MQQNNQGGQLLPPHLLEKIRSQFYYVEEGPQSGRRIFFDSASGSLRLKEMVNTVQQELPSYAQFKRTDPASRHAEERVEQAVSDLQAFTGAPEGSFYFGPSSSQSVFYLVDVILSSAPPDANVVTTNLDHPATYEATHFFSQKYKLDRRVVTFNREQGRLEKDEVLKRIDKKTALLALIHASNITGAINPLEQIIQKAREINPQIYVLVDGVQFAPHSPLHMQVLDPDAYVFGGYKIFCKKGMAFAYLSPRMAHLPHWQFRGLAEDDWVLGTLDEATLAGFSAVVDYVAGLGQSFSQSSRRREQILAGMEGIHSHSRALLQRMLFGGGGVQGLFSMDHVTVYGIDPQDMEERTSLVSFRIEGMDGGEAAARYWQEGISISPRLDNVFSRHILKVLGVKDVARASMCHYNTEDEVKTFLQVTEGFKKG